MKKGWVIIKRELAAILAINPLHKLNSTELGARFGEPSFAIELCSTLLRIENYVVPRDT